jgi:hypothetical protein
MRALEQPLLERKALLQATKRLALIPEGVGLGDSAADHSIHARVPAVRLEPGAGLFRGRRRRIRFDGAASGVAVCARLRPAPSVGARIQVEVARDSNGDPVPVACVDPDTATVHLLLELSRATMEDGFGPDPIGAVAEALFAKPLASIASADTGDVVVGKDVEARVRSLANRGGGLRMRIEREVAFLRRARDAGEDHLAVTARLERLERYLAEAPEAPHLTDAEGEVSRLKRLVESRAVGFLCFHDDEIVGLLNPVRLDECRWRAPLAFGLRLRDGRRETVLRFWSPDPPADEYRVPCLGRASDMLPQLGDERDVFGVVDAVVNFAETNHIGVTRLGERPALGRLWASF